MKSGIFLFDNHTILQKLFSCIFAPWNQNDNNVYLTLFYTIWEKSSSLKFPI